MCRIPDTRELADRLAHLGGDDMEDLYDEDNIGCDDIVSALGMRTDQKDDILLSEISAQLSQTWQHSAGATQPRALNSSNVHPDEERHIAAAAEQAFEIQHMPSVPASKPKPFQFTQ